MNLRPRKSIDGSDGRGEDLEDEGRVSFSFIKHKDELSNFILCFLFPSVAVSIK